MKAESDGYTDAVGDIAGARLGPYATRELAVADYAARVAAKKQVPVPYEIVQGNLGWYVKNTKWRCSIGGPQIRCLVHPEQYAGTVDALRVAEKMRDPLYQMQVMFAIWQHDGNFNKWSTFVHGTYEQYLGQDFELRTGHPDADKWDI